MTELRDTGSSKTQERENDKIKPDELRWNKFQKDRREHREKHNKQKIKQTSVKMKKAQ